MVAGGEAAPRRPCLLLSPVYNRTGNVEDWSQFGFRSFDAASAFTSSTPRKRHATLRSLPVNRHARATYRLLNGFSSGTRSMPPNPAALASSRSVGSGRPTVPSPSPPAASELVMQ
jgi:hypothetical protein